MINYLFHVHTHRCKHAEKTPDEEYVKLAIKHGYRRLYFADHCPFPGDPFTNRMDYKELDEYIDNLSALRDKYNNIKIYIGLETEYLREYKDYYPELLNKTDFLLLGQHIFKFNNKYCFELPSETVDAVEKYECCKLILEAINLKYFKYVAHPDRIFRHSKEWNAEDIAISNKIIAQAQKQNVMLEKNYESLNTPGYYREEFWTSVPEEMVIYGADAHSLSDVNGYYYTLTKQAGNKHIGFA